MDAPLPQGLVPAIEEFLREDSKRVAGLDVYEEVFSNPVMFPLQRQCEMAEMMRTARSINPQVVMEIGSDKAGGYYHWVKSLPSVRRAIACEVRGTPYAEAFSKAIPYVDQLFIPHSSYDLTTVGNVERWLGRDKIDCLFIDGDKSHFDTDFYSYLPLMSPRGIVFMHDINDRPPRIAYDKCSKDYAHREYIDIEDSLAALRRQQAGVPVSCAHEGWLRHWAGASCGVGIIYLGGTP